MADYYSLISRVVSKLDKNTAESRKVLYERARAMLIDQLGKRQPSATDHEIMRERVAFDDAIRKVELELTSGANSGIDRPSPTTCSDEGQHGRIFEQPSPQANEPRGRIDLSEGGAIVTLLKNADNSTFPHLMSHLWLDELVRDAARPDVSQALKEDLGTVLRWLGVKKPKDIGVAQYEQWARAFEQYLAQGRAPSAALAPVFEKFKKADADLNSRDIGTPLTDEVREVMDRMLATDKEIAETRNQSSERPVTVTSPNFQGALFFVIAFVFVIFLEGLLLAGYEALTNRRAIPRGLGWLVLPFLAGIAGWTFGKEFGFDSILKLGSEKLEELGSRKIFRVWFAVSVLWVMMVLAIFLVFDPFGRYRWHGDEWLKFFSILLGLPIFGLLGGFLFEWALKDKQ